MNVLIMLEPYFLPLLVALLVLLAGAIPLYLHHRRTQQQPAQRSAAPRPTPAALRLRRSFRCARTLIRRHVPGHNAIYQIPWFLLLWESASGKTSLLQAAGLRTPFGTAAAEPLANHTGCRWWFFEHGIVLDTDGAYILTGTGSISDTRSWQTLLRLLQWYRPARPLDGIIMTIPCTELLGAPEQHSARLAQATQKATGLTEKLWQAQRLLGLRLPVYLLITKCDQINGFQSFYAALPTRVREDIFGWSNPYTLEAAYVPRWLDEAFEALSTQLAQVQMEVMAHSAPLQDRDGFFLFPQAFEEVREPIRVYIDHLFASSAYHEAFFFRGLYFCGDGQLDAVPALTRTAPAEATAAALPADPAQPLAVGPRPCFLKQLFKAKIFPEYRLAHPASQTFVIRSRTVLAAQALLIGVLLIGGLGMWRAHSRLVTEQHTLQPVLREIATDVGRRRGKATLGDTQFNRETLHLLQGMSRADASGLRSLFFPESWFDTLHREIVKALTAAYSTVILQAMGQEFHHKAQQILQGPPPRPEAIARQSLPLGIDSTPEFVTLRHQITAWAEFEKYAGLYNTHIVAARANDLNGLSQVV